MAYADDLILLAPTSSALTRMLQICSNFALDFDVKCSLDKSEHIMFSQSASTQMQKDFVMDGKTIPNASYGTRLGIPIGSGARIFLLTLSCSCPY